MLDSILSGLDASTILMIGTAFVVLSIVGTFLSVFLRGQRKEKMTRVLLDKTVDAQSRVASVILDAEARVMRQASREQEYTFELVNWHAIRRDMRRAGLKGILGFPPLVFLVALVLAYLVAVVIIAAPIYPIWAQALGVYPAMFIFVRKAILGMIYESRKMKMMAQMINFIESVQRAVSVGTSPDEAVAEAIRETENPLQENLSEIKNLLDLGYDFVDAINLAADRVNLAEFDIFAASISAQSSTGGSVGEVLKEVVSIARARLDLQRKINTMTAEGRFNAGLLGSLPVLLTLYLRTVQGDYFDTLWMEQNQPHGAMIFFLTLGGAVTGAWLAMRIAKVSV